MSMIGILATVVIRLAAYGGGASIDGGDIGIATYRPGWEGGVPKDACRVTDDWRQETNGVTCVSRVKFLKDIDLQCVGLMWRVNAALTANRDWSADDKVRQVPEKFGSIGLGEGTARRFSLPLPEGRTLVAEFPEAVAYTAQDGRRWGDKWFIRFGPALGRRVHPAGEEIVYSVRYTSSEGVRIERSEPCAMSVGENWAKFENRKDIVSGSALDFSGQGLQDAPAGKYGWLKAVGGCFEFEAKPGVAQRFYGVNLCFMACYPSHEDADLIVERFVRLGYNTIRIHHHDDRWAKHPEDRERLDYLVARAIGRGLYVTTDLYVSRKVSWQELGRNREGELNAQLYKSLVLVDDAAYANWAAFAREFLEHVNPYTGRAYKDEPGLPLVSLINEGNLGMGFGYSGKATDPTLLGAWREFTGDPNAASVPNPWTNDRAKAFDVENSRRFLKKATVFLRELGVKALLTNDNNGSRHGEGEGLTPLYDYVDNHFYIDHPEFLENRWQLPSKCPNANPVQVGQPRLFAKGYANGASKPYAITEWNFSGPGRYRALGGILTGALAARDEWDALWRFAYSHSRDNWRDGPKQCPGYFDCATDPLSQASDRASVCLFLRGDANEGQVTTDAKTGTMSFVSPRTCGGFVEQGRFKAGGFAADVAGAPAAVWASSLDGQSLAASKRILVVHLTDVQGEGNVYADATRQILLKWGRGCLVEKGSAKVALVHPGDLTAWALDTTGRRVREIPVRRKGEWVLFDCSTDGGTIYYELADKVRPDPTGAVDFAVEAPRNASGLTIDASAFGVSSEAADNGTAMNRALRHCRERGAARLVVPKGVYRFTADRPIEMAGMRDFVLDGGGSTFVFLRKAGPSFLFARNERTEVRNLSVDWDWSVDPLGSIVEVVEADRTHVDFRFVDYERFPRRDVRAAYISAWDGEARAVGVRGQTPLGRGFDMAWGATPRNDPKKEWLSDNVLRIRRGAADLPVGSRWRMQHYYYDLNCFVLDSNRHFKIADVDVRSCVGFAFLIRGAQRYTHFSRVNIRPPSDDPRRVITCTADHVHVERSNGFLKLENCDFALGADDCLNVHDCTAWAPVVCAANALEVRNGGAALDVGDLAEIRNADYSPCAAAGRSEAGPCRVVAKKPVEGNPRGAVLTFDRPIPPQTHKDGFVVFNRSFCSDNVVLRNCTFRDNRARGVIIQASDVTIENCRFSHNESQALKITTGWTEDLWCEGTGVTNCVVRNCTFENCRAGGDPADMIVLLSYLHQPSYDKRTEKSSYPVIDGVLFEGNRIVGEGRRPRPDAACGQIVQRDWAGE